MRVKIMGRMWEFCRLSQLRKNYGWCDDPKTKGKRIAVWSRLTGLTELDTTIHECIHAGLPDIKEDTVSEFATDLARVLWRLGYRKVE